MELVIFCDSYPPEKKTWSSPNIADRLEWSWVSELIATWFCYSNGIRKENSVVVVVNDLQFTLKGDEMRYLAPSQRSVLAIFYNAYRAYQFKNKKQHQPGVYIDSFGGLDQFNKPWINIELTSERAFQNNLVGPEIKTIIVEGKHEHIPRLHITANDYNQALIWTIYG